MESYSISLAAIFSSKAVRLLSLYLGLHLVTRPIHRPNLLLGLFFNGPAHRPTPFVLSTRHLVDPAGSLNYPPDSSRQDWCGAGFVAIFHRKKSSSFNPAIFTESIIPFVFDLVNVENVPSSGSNWSVNAILNPVGIEASSSSPVVSGTDESHILMPGVGIFTAAVW